MTDAAEHTKMLDYVVVSAIAVGVVIMVWGNAIMVWHRKYRPIKTKNVPLTLSSSVGGIIWIMATIVVGHHFPRPRKYGFNICILWTFWLELCFGFSLWLNCLTFHLFTLFRIFIHVSSVRFRDYLFFLLLLLPTISVSIFASIKHKEVMKYSISKDGRGECRFQTNSGYHWPHLLLTFMWINFLVFILFAFRLRHAMAQYNEYRLIRRGGILSLFLFLLFLVTVQTDAYVESVGRCFLSAAVASAVFYYFWARNGVVIYNVMFNHDDYLEKFNAGFRRHLSEREWALSGSQRNLQVQLKEVTEEVQQCLNTIKQLEDEVNTLETECNKLEQQGNVKDSVLS